MKKDNKSEIYNRIKTQRLNEKIEMVNVQKPQFLYEMFDKDLNIIYIGQTKNITQRINSHKVLQGLDNINVRENSVLKEDAVKEVEYIRFALLPNKYWSNVYELTYISMFKPKFNTDLKYLSDSYLDLPKLTWYKYYSTSFYSRFIMEFGNIDLKYLTDPIERSLKFTQYIKDNYRKLHLGKNYMWYISEDN